MPTIDEVKERRIGNTELFSLIKDLLEKERKHFDSTKSQVEKTDQKLDEHIKIYKANGIESKRVADNLVTLISTVGDIGKKLDGVESKVDLMYGSVYKDYEGEQYMKTRTKDSMTRVVLFASVITAIIVIATFIVKIGLSSTTIIK